MVRERAVTNTGPILHLSEIRATNALNIFPKIFCPQSVHNEILARIGETKLKNLEIKGIAPKHKDLAVRIHLEFQIGIAEADAIVLCKQEKIKIFLTDDLEARITAKKMNIQPVGSIGIILRAFREKILSRQESINLLTALHTESSLFITPQLINKAIEAIQKFGRKSQK